MSWETVAWIRTGAWLLLIVLVGLAACWVARSLLRERRQKRAAKWAQSQVSAPAERTCQSPVTERPPIKSSRADQHRVSSMADTKVRIRRVRPYLPQGADSGVSATGRHVRKDEVADAETQEFSVDVSAHASPRRQLHSSIPR